MKEHQARETAKIEGSTNSGMLIRDIPKFDGNPGTFEISSYEGIVKSRCFSGTTKISLLVGVACADTRAAGRTRRTCRADEEETGCRPSVSKRTDRCEATVKRLFGGCGNFFKF